MFDFARRNTFPTKINGEKYICHINILLYLHIYKNIWRCDLKTELGWIFYLNFQNKMVPAYAVHGQKGKCNFWEGLLGGAALVCSSTGAEERTGGRRL